MTAEEWARYKKAAKEYSRLKPQLIYDATWTPEQDVKVQSLPETYYFGIESIDYGVQGSLTDVLNEDVTDEEAWAFERGIFAITPAPEEDLEIKVLWQAEYQPDEDAQTFPDIPEYDLPYIDQLANALLLEEQAETKLNQPVKYQLGQKMVDLGTTPNDLQIRAKHIRSQVYLALCAYNALWG